MWSRWIEIILQRHRRKEADLDQASRRIALSIERYRSLSREIQTEVRKNHFAKNLIYRSSDED
ncbi:hypothetical protein EJP77_02905 [Paenibacillus zeisoli]|uniref:Uncharacterized protein n=1 Tax=Paenibacillus zeisoli TaxID=2496267 RepID=A0A3S1D366_9BACL|nr:hypothetical protein [Paenibacillus zeisoli]RUT35964.1 hypothetical protein EJP77_02905 [Paenibacillus zeisoli]